MVFLVDSGKHELHDVDHMDGQGEDEAENRSRLQLNEESFGDGIREQRHTQPALDRIELHGEEGDQLPVENEGDNCADGEEEERDKDTIPELGDVVENRHLLVGIGVFFCHFDGSGRAFLAILRRGGVLLFLILAVEAILGSFVEFLLGLAKRTREFGNCARAEKDQNHQSDNE